MPTKRRGHNEGTIYQRADGKWEAKVSLPDGRRRKRVTDTRRAAQLALAELQRTSESAVLTPARLTVADYLDHWLTATAAERQARTQDKYEQHCRSHIVPALGRLQLTRLGPAECQRLQNDLLTRGLASPTVHSVMSTLRRALGDAVRWGWLPSSPISRIRVVADTPADVEALSEAEARAILRAVEGRRYEAAFLLALLLAMRQGEILGLRWRDLDLARGMVRVEGALKRVPASQRAPGAPALVRGDPKTVKSRRALPLPRRCLDALTAYAAAHPGQPDELVFRTRTGKPVHSRVLTLAFQRALTSAGITPFRFRDLRHHAASLMFAAGEPPAVVQEILGHSTPKLTMTVYRRLPAEVLTRAARRMDVLLDGASE